MLSSAACSNGCHETVMKLHNSFLDSKRTVILSSTIVRSQSALFVVAAFSKRNSEVPVFYIGFC